ncbi:MAG: apolipoprotein N-acyltransferase [Burkholderiaceae bacterium]|nr:apolipoprotein N-acyltransferase [Burkholderiaceae bacterium]
MRLRVAPGAPAALVAGILHAASFAPIGTWWLQTATLAALAALVLRAHARDAAGAARGAALGMAFGLGWFVAGVAWLYVSMHRYGGMPAPIAALALLLFGAYLALFPATACALALRAVSIAWPGARAPRSFALVAAGMVFAGCWALAEIARGWLFTGFPWLAIGYAHVDGPLAALAPLVGVYGVCAFAALSAWGIGAAAFAGSRGATARAVAGAIALAVAPPAAGWALGGLQWSQPTGHRLAVRLLQGNVPQELKFDPARSLAAMQAYAAEAMRARADLTVLPETAWTVPWSATPAPLRDALLGHLARSGGVLAIGMPLPEQAAPGQAVSRLTNSVAVIDREGAIAARYDKRHLVPFGEFVPRGFGWFVALMNIPLGEFGRGAKLQPPLDIDGQRVAFDVCYEDLFGEELAVQVRDGATILVNVSNIAWFGDSHALPQHLQIARMRAIELARPVLRATNTGVTAAIDARGRVVDALPTYTAGALALSLQGSAGLTPYARWGNALPLALALALALSGTLACVVARRSAGSNPLE